MQAVESQLAAIRAEVDTNRKNVLVAALISGLFREAGFDPVIVGGSAVEIYTDGQYVSGDVDVCFAGAKLPTPRQREEIMARVSRPLTSRKWDVHGVMVELLGFVETTARTPFQTIGAVKVIQIEDLIAERLLTATYPQPNPEYGKVVRVLLGAILRGDVSADRAELERVADSPDYLVGKDLRCLLEELS